MQSAISSLISCISNTLTTFVNHTLGSFGYILVTKFSLRMGNPICVCTTPTLPLPFNALQCIFPRLKFFCSTTRIRSCTTYVMLQSFLMSLFIATLRYVHSLFFIALLSHLSNGSIVPWYMFHYIYPNEK